MSVICNKCGIQTRDAAKFCHGCGNPIATAALPPTMPIGVPSGDIPPKPAVPLAPEPPLGSGFPKATEAMGVPRTSYIPQAPVPNYQQTLARPKKSGNGIKIFVGILIFLGVIAAGAIGTGLFIANKFANKVASSMDKANSNGIVIPLGDGKVKIGTPVSEEEIGVPVYPGAKSSQLSISGQTDTGEGGSFTTLETRDEYDNVVEWYLEKLGNDARRTKREDNEKKVTKFELTDARGFRSVEIIGYYRNRKNTEIKIFSAMEGLPEPAVPPAPVSQAGKKKSTIPVPPAPASAEDLGKKIEKQTNESINQAEKLVDDHLNNPAIPAKIKRQIKEQIREARRQERNGTAAPNQD